MTSFPDLKNTESETGWKPTAYLKYVGKKLAGPTIYESKKLVQLWINSDGRDEWRDVPFGE